MTISPGSMQTLALPIAWHSVDPELENPNDTQQCSSSCDPKISRATSHRRCPNILYMAWPYAHPIFTFLHHE